MVNSHDAFDNKPEGDPTWLFSRTGLATATALAVLGFLVYRGHTAHLLGFAPYLLIFSCPLMHIFMHGRHGSHHPHNHNESSGGCCGGGHDRDTERDGKSSDQSSQGEK